MFLSLRRKRKVKPIELKIAWASYQSAVYACKHWHYSHSIPAGKLVKVGVWENGLFKGVVIFSHGANKNIGSPYNLEQHEVCELTRVALRKHTTPVTKIISIAIKMLRKFCPELKLIVSYADVDQGHAGKIYQAGNWIYEGLKQGSHLNQFIFKGRKVHKKTIHSKYGTGSQSISFLKKIDPNVREFVSKGKHKYLYTLDDSIRSDILKRAKPFPSGSAVHTAV